MSFEREPRESWPFALERQLAGVFDVDAWQPLDGAILFQGRFLLEPGPALHILTQRLAPYGYAAQIRSPEAIALFRLPPEGPRGARRRLENPALHLLLFLVTVVTTLYAGLEGEFGGEMPKLLTVLRNPLLLLQGLPFAATLLSILTVHELGHYFTARHYGIRVSLPYFIPAPVGLGTFGAFIKMQSPVTDRRALFDVGASGPLAGLVLALPALFIGLSRSQVLPLHQIPRGEPELVLGPSLLFTVALQLVFGHLPADQTIALSPVALAAWFGLFVTALNLLPMGQLDGGHIAYALLGRRHQLVGVLTIGILFALGGVFQQFVWLFWALLGLALGLRHPPPLDDLTPLDPGRRVVGILSFLLFLSLFTPFPFLVVP